MIFRSYSYPFRFALVMGVLVGCSSPWSSHSNSAIQDSPREGPAIDWQDVEDTLRTRVLSWIDSDRLKRDDGNLYTVDAAQLMTYAALRRDQKLYDTLRSVALTARVDATKNPYLRGFVTWRTGADPDASGTTEALRLAEALWRGGKAFAQPDDVHAAVEIIEGYRRHEYVDQGIWLIRNYYNLNTGSFATNSFLVDYDPDLIAEIAREHPEFKELSLKVNQLVRSAETPSGLLHELIQPEVLTAMPTLGTAVFSPSNLAQLSNSCAVLERSTTTHPSLAKRLLEFSLKQEPLAPKNHRTSTRGVADARSCAAAQGVTPQSMLTHHRGWRDRVRKQNRADAASQRKAGDFSGLGLIYNVNTGARHGTALAGIETLGCLARLARKLGQNTTRFEKSLDWYVQDFQENEPQPRAYTASELMLTIAVLFPELR